LAVRTVIAFSVAVAVAIVSSFYASALWSDAVLIGRSFGTTSAWWSPLHLLDLLDDCALLLIAGAIFAVVATPPRPFLWGIGMGIAFCGIRFALSANWFSPEAPASAYLWAYSPFYIPVVFGGIGASAGSRWLRARSSVLPNKSSERKREG
jgi:pimeloyl-ACP methyl ester carboxylesterase